MDKNEKGLLTIEQLKEVVNELEIDMAEDEIRDLVKTISRGKEFITMDEFVKGLSRKSNLLV